MVSNDDSIDRAFSLILDNLAENILTTARINIVKHNQVYTGETFDSGHIEKTGLLEREIIFDAPQAVWQEYGTHPHPVSLKGREAIAKWAEKKLGMSPAEARNLAWGYANKVQKVGTEPRPFLRPAIDEELIRSGMI